MHNVLTFANYETKLALAELKDKPGAAKEPIEPTVDGPWPQQRIAQAGELLLKYMLFRNEAPLHGPLKGTSSFASDFEHAGTLTPDGRSLREFDLKKRLFRYPCSFLIQSPSFDELPVEMKRYLWRRLKQILEGRDDSAIYMDMPAADRQAVFEILRQTKPEFADWLRR
jgi:hypothetical protein